MTTTQTYLTLDEAYANALWLLAETGFRMLDHQTRNRGIWVRYQSLENDVVGEEFYSWEYLESL
jgi:hypothetical protein